MYMTVDQLIATNNTNLDTLNGLTAKTYAGFGKLVELNLAAARALMTESFTHIQSLMAAKDAPQIIALQSGLLAPMAGKAASYGRHVYGILVEASSEFTKVFESKAAEGQKALSEAMDSLTKNAPAGTEAAIAVIKSAMASSQSALESAQATARKALTMAENNVSAATEQALSAVVAKA